MHTLMHTLLAGRWRLVGVALAVLAGFTAPAYAATPGGATPVAPSGVIAGTTHVFTFQGVPAATFYYFQLNDATASPRFTLWFPAGQVCPAASATCSLTLRTATTNAGNATQATVFNPITGIYNGNAPKANTHPTWCVRGGHALIGP